MGHISSSGTVTCSGALRRNGRHVQKRIRCAFEKVAAVGSFDGCRFGALQVRLDRTCSFLHGWDRSLRIPSFQRTPNQIAATSKSHGKSTAGPSWSLGKFSRQIARQIPSHKFGGFLHNNMQSHHNTMCMLIHMNACYIATLDQHLCMLTTAHGDPQTPHPCTGNPGMSMIHHACQCQNHDASEGAITVHSLTSHPA